MSEQLLREVVEQARRERERAEEVLTGNCPACTGTTRWPDEKRSRKGTCSLCELEETPGRMARPRKWWLDVAGREP